MLTFSDLQRRISRVPSTVRVTTRYGDNGCLDDNLCHPGSDNDCHLALVLFTDQELLGVVPERPEGHAQKLRGSRLHALATR